ncbi:MAG TPA: methyltransferase domain-containing protein [Vicinamibacterales bacterium]|nr:methyltransferase domain-containing protein [Vicinamibacterales bacterium]
MSKPVPAAQASPDFDVTTARRYFSSFADDYHRAFHGTGRDPLHALLNRLFRRKTFQMRTHVVESLLRAHAVSGKQVLDLGCGSGEVSLLAAGMGANVTGFDIVPAMVELARRDAQAAGMAGRTRFEVRDVYTGEVPPSDVTLIVAVIEYYKEISSFLQRVAGGTRELLIVVDTRGPWWRRMLRYGLARYKRFHLYYRSPDEVSAAIVAAGFVEESRTLGHSYSVLAFRRV